MTSNDMCKNSCPYSNNANFSDIGTSCKGPRIMLDDWECAVEDGKIVGELAKIACGSRVGPDSELPTISFQDWADTPLSPSQLKKLHERGMLPDQNL